MSIISARITNQRQTHLRNEPQAMTPTVILPYTSKRTTREDITQIANHLYHHAPTARLFAFPDEITPIALAEPMSPQTITVTLNNNSPSIIFDFIPGPKFFAPQKTKSQLVDDLIAAGIPVPHTQRFSPEVVLDEAKFGPYTAIKTSVPGTSRATGINVFKTRDFDSLRERLMSMYRKDMQDGHIPLLQQYIPSGPNPTHTRVSTFLGSPIVCFETRAPKAFSPASLDGLAGSEATSNFSDDRIRKLVNDEAMIDMAQCISTVFPEASVLSIDMVRCVESGKLYCIEANLGNLCVLSAPICARLNQDLGGPAVHTQFMSYDTIARRIAETLNTTF
jgi:hypothetical protein